MPKYGRRPPKNAPALRLASFLTGTIPDHPATADYLNIGGWQMLGNDTYGDCVAVTWANERRLLSRQAGAEKYPTIDQVIAFYKTQNPGFPSQDDGMDIQTALERLVQVGGPDGVKAVAFAKVDYTNPDEVKAAIAVFGQVWIGINVQDANQTDFSAGKPWDYHPGNPIEGGHSIIGGGYDSDAKAGDERFVTWGAETSFTDAFWSHLVEECWVVIWPEHFGQVPFLVGTDEEKLAAAYVAITGKVLQVPPPVNPPTPGPVASFPGSAATAAELARLAKSHKLSDWVAYIEYRFPGDT